MANKLWTRALAATATLTLLAATAACTAKPQVHFTPKAGPLNVVVSIPVWANIVKHIGGRYVVVKSVIHSSMQDPHSYSASARDQLLVNQADITFNNGFGYDDFFSALAKASPNLDQRLKLHAWCESVCALMAAGGGYSDTILTGNPHVWFHLVSTASTVKHTAAALESSLSSTDGKAAIRAGEQRMLNQVAELQKIERVSRATTKGKSALLTEGFAAYLVHDLGMKNVTPQSFRNAVENEADAAPSVMNLLRKQIQGHRVSVVITNKLTNTSQTDQLVAWAKQAGVPVLNLTESLPNGQNYSHWMASNIEKIVTAVK
jgi:zinc/manganese transport system substrate-binding protein